MTRNGLRITGALAAVLLLSAAGCSGPAPTAPPGKQGVAPTASPAGQAPTSPASPGGGATSAASLGIDANGSYNVVGTVSAVDKSQAPHSDPGPVKVTLMFDATENGVPVRAFVEVYPVAETHFTTSTGRAVKVSMELPAADGAIRALGRYVRVTFQPGARGNSAASEIVGYAASPGVPAVELDPASPPQRAGEFRGRLQGEDSSGSGDTVYVLGPVTYGTAVVSVRQPFAVTSATTADTGAGAKPAKDLLGQGVLEGPVTVTCTRSGGTLTATSIKKGL